MVETFGERAKRISKLFKQADEKKKEQEDKLAPGVIESEIGINRFRKRPPTATTISVARGILAAIIVILGTIKWGVV